METVAPFKEVIDEIKEAGGDVFKLCFQCGLCDTVCPWNRVRDFSMRKIIREATFGLTDIETEEMWRCTTCGNCPARCPRGVEQIEVGVAIGLLVILFLAVLGITRSAPLPPAEFSFNNGAEVSTLDPATISSVPEGRIVRALFEGLTTYHPTDDSIHNPGVAKTWDSNEDFTEWTMKLRDGVMFHDGTPLNAHDVVATYQKIIDYLDRISLWEDMVDFLLEN